MASWSNRESGLSARYQLTPEDGSAAFFATLVLADEPINIGTPVDTDAFLKASTSVLYGINDPTSATPDDIFALIANRLSMLGGDSTTLLAAITAETERSTAAEQALQSNIDSAQSALQDNIDIVSTTLTAEVNRATAAEQALQSNIDDNYSDLNSRVATNTANISTNYTSLINLISAESTRAAQAEQALQGNIDTVSTTLTAEVDRATQAEQALQTTLSSETNTRSANDITSVSFDDVNPNNLVFTRSNGDELELAIRVANATNDGFMSAAQVAQLTNNTGDINAMRNGLWVRANLGVAPSQSDITDAWATIMGGSTVPVGARVTNDDENTPMGADYFYIIGSDGNPSWVNKSTQTSAIQASVGLSGDVVASPLAIGFGVVLSTTLSPTGVVAGNYGESSSRLIPDGGNFAITRLAIDSKGRTVNASNYTLTLTASRYGLLTGLSTSVSSAVVATDNIVVGMGKLQAQMGNKEPSLVSGTTAQYLRGDKTWSSLSTDVLALSLNNIVFSQTSPISSTDTILSAFGKLQGQISSQNTAISGLQPKINGNGFVKATGTTISFDDTVYAPQSALTSALSNKVNGAPISTANAYWYGESTTVASNAQKVVSIPAITTLNSGQVIFVKASASNTATAPKIALNSFSVYPINYKGSAAVGNVAWFAGQVSAYQFDGSAWNYVGANDNTEYLALTSAQLIAGTDTTLRTVRADYLKAGILGTTLTGFSTSNNSVITSSDNILGSFGKLQAQINALGAVSNFATGTYGGVLSSVPLSVTPISTLDISVVFGSIQNGMEIVDINGNLAVISNLDSNNNTATATTTKRGLENIPVLLQANENAFGVVSITILNGGNGYNIHDEFTINGVEATVESISPTGSITSIWFDGLVQYSYDVAGTNFAVSGGTGSGATASIVTAYAVGADRVVGELGHVTENDPLISSSRLRGFVNELLPVGGKEISEQGVWGEHLSFGAIQTLSSVGIERDEEKNIIIDDISEKMLVAVEDGEEITLNYTFGLSISGKQKNVIVDWGDGITETFTSYNEAIFSTTHIYDDAGEYIIKFYNFLSVVTPNITSNSNGVLEIFLVPDGNAYSITISHEEFGETTITAPLFESSLVAGGFSQNTNYKITITDNNQGVNNG